jgi:hypothetical protein
MLPRHILGDSRLQFKERKEYALAQRVSSIILSVACRLWTVAGLKPFSAWLPSRPTVLVFVGKTQALDFRAFVVELVHAEQVVEQEEDAGAHENE